MKKVIESGFDCDKQYTFTISGKEHGEDVSATRTLDPKKYVKGCQSTTPTEEKLDLSNYIVIYGSLADEKDDFLVKLEDSISKDMMFIYATATLKGTNTPSTLKVTSGGDKIFIDPKDVKGTTTNADNVHIWSCKDIITLEIDVLPRDKDSIKIIKEINIKDKLKNCPK